MDFIYDELMGEYGAVTFEAFINLLVSLTRYRASRLTDGCFVRSHRLILRKIRRLPNSCARRSRALPRTRYGGLSYCYHVIVSSCHRSHVIYSQPFVTELDLRVAHLPISAIEYLREAMPSGSSETGEAIYDYEGWLDDVFA
jgi:Ca2+ insensitive EF hand